MPLTTPKTHILLIDDCKFSLKTTTLYLERNGFILSAASNGQEGLTLAQQATPDLILLDILMPDLNGIETCQRLKANRHTREIPIIFLTSLKDVMEKVNAFAVGGIDYLVKPIKETELIAHITIRLQWHRLFQQLRQQLQHYEQRYGLLDISSSPVQSIHPKELKNIYRVQQYLLDHLDTDDSTDDSLEKLAELASTNRNKLNHHFQRLFWMSVFTWLREQRLQKASHLLRTTGLRIQEIGMSVGYDSSTYFTSAFKQRFGVAPKNTVSPFEINPLEVARHQGRHAQGGDHDRHPSSKLMSDNPPMITIEKFVRETK